MLIRRIIREGTRDHHRLLIYLHIYPFTHSSSSLSLYTQTQVQKQQEIWIICCAILQLSAMLYLNYTAYRPLAKLRKILEEKGFANPKDRPTVVKYVCR